MAWSRTMRCRECGRESLDSRWSPLCPVCHESLHHEHDDAVSHSYDLYVGVRVLPWLDLYVNPEMIRGGGADRGPVSVIGVRLHFEGAVGYA